MHGIGRLHINEESLEIEKQFASSIWDNISRLTVNDAYVTSFTYNADNQLHWRSYGRSGQGYCICFDYPRMEKIFRPHANFGPVIYDPEVQLSAIKQFVNTYLVCAAEQSTGKREHIVEALIDRASASLELLIPTFKNKDFQKEKEVRLTYWNAGCFDELRKKNPSGYTRPCMGGVSKCGLIVPFVKLHPNGEAETKLPISEIVVGRALDYDKSKKSVEVILENSGYSKTEVQVRQSALRLA